MEKTLLSLALISIVALAFAEVLLSINSEARHSANVEVSEPLLAEDQSQKKPMAPEHAEGDD